MKKTPGDIIILHKCTKNHDYMLHCSWDMVCDQCNCYFSFWATFYHPNILENQIRTKYHYHMLYCSWDMAHDICNCYFSFVGYFCPFTLLTAQKSTFQKKKKKKTSGDIIILHICTINYDQMMYGSWDMVHDRRMDGRTEKVTYRGRYLKIDNHY